MVVQSQSLDAYDDRRLVAAFQAGDADAFAQIVGAHHSSLTAEARRRLRSSGDAEDAVQETLLRAYLALDRFGGEYHLHAWLSRILANVCADTGARHSAELRLVDRLGAPRDEAPPADEWIGDSDQQRAIKEAVDSLPESYRTAFVLREIQEFSYAEVAEKMGISETNARARVHRARRSLTRALRNTGAVLAGIPIPLHLVGLKRVFPRSASKRFSGLASYSSNPRVVSRGPEIPTNALPVASQSSLPTLFQAPLAETSQAVALAAATPLSQTIIAGASVAWHATLPVAAALATVAASAAMVGSGAAASGPTTPDPAVSSHIIMAEGTTDLASFVNDPAASSKTSSSGPASGTSAATSSSPAASTTSVTGSASTSTSDPWSWVGSAASGTAGGDATTSSSSGSQVSTQAAGTSASTGEAPPIVCPWTGTFPGAPDTPIALPPPEPAGAVASSYFSSDTFTLGTAGTAGAAFEVGGLGQFGQGANSITLQTLYGACTLATSNPELVANLSNPSDEALGQLQLRGALVSSQTVNGDTTAYYRGTAVWLDGPNASTATPLVFVAQVTLGEPTNISTLRVAFFGPVPTFTPPLTCPPGTTPTSSQTTGTGLSTSSGSDSSATSGTSPMGSPTCTTPSTPSTTTTTAPTPPSSTPPTPSTDSGGSSDGSSSSDTSPTNTTSPSDPPTSAAIATSTRWTP
ncbi:MAG TPA: RNA polymerase sigma factor [Acidimicrobiales bacterium]|nr:RNA polymerase sigma factor [Acidimicrobiales bacterium]